MNNKITTFITKRQLFSANSKLFMEDVQVDNEVKTRMLTPLKSSFKSNSYIAFQICSAVMKKSLPRCKNKIHTFLLPLLSSSHSLLNTIQRKVYRKSDSPLLTCAVFKQPTSNHICRPIVNKHNCHEHKLLERMKQYTESL